jgi:hypothetical protein
MPSPRKALGSRYGVNAGDGTRNAKNQGSAVLWGVGTGEFMLSRCANSQCSKPFLRLREGKLFLVETERLNKPGASAAPPFVRARQVPRQVEHYWLCDECAAH